MCTAPRHAMRDELPSLSVTTDVSRTHTKDRRLPAGTSLRPLPMSMDETENGGWKLAVL